MVSQGVYHCHCCQPSSQDESRCIRSTAYQRARASFEFNAERLRLRAYRRILDRQSSLNDGMLDAWGGGDAPTMSLVDGDVPVRNDCDVDEACRGLDDIGDG